MCVRFARRVVVLAVVLFASVLAPANAHADDISLSSGILDVATNGTAFFNLHGTDFGVTGAVDVGRWLGSRECVGGCMDGTVVGLTSSFGALSGPLAYGYAAKVNGASYVLPYGPVWYSGTLTFDTSSISLGGGATSYVLPFTFSGRVQGHSLSDLSDPALFDVSLLGQGDATLSVVYDSSRHSYQFDSLCYRFNESATTVTPEPGSMLLLASGVAAALGLRRSRGKRSRVGSGTSLA